MSWADDFLRGQRDCRQGIPHQEQGDAYSRGYKAEYDLQQVEDWITGKMYGHQKTE